MNLMIIFMAGLIGIYLIEVECKFMDRPRS